MVSFAYYEKLVKLAKLEYAVSNKPYDELLIKIRSDNELSTEQKLSLESILTEGEQIAPANTKNVVYYPNNYNINDTSLLPDWKSLYSGDYMGFIDKVLFDKFFHIPHLDIQKPIITSLMFLNSLVVPENTALPLFYFLSNKPNSGKSTLARFISYHYPTQYRLYLAEDTSGGGLRNLISNLTQDNQPCIVILDNFHPTLTVQRLGSFYGRLLKYTKAESLVSIADQTGKGTTTFNTHSLKIFTSIYPLDKRTVELKSRCFTLYFEPSESKKESIDNYNWDDLIYQYHNVWGNVDRVNKEFGSIFRAVNRLNPDQIMNRQWQISKYLLATGTYIGVWDTPEQGLNHLAEYWVWVERINTDKSTIPLEMAIEDYVTNIHKTEVEREFIRQNGVDCFLKENVIDIDMLYKYLKTILPINRTTRTDNEITYIMKSLGWSPTLAKTITGRSISIQYVRD